MRVIAGLYKGLKLNDFELENIRPTTDKVRESIFNIIQFKVSGSTFLDLFGGTGAISIEAVSRGANVFVVDSNKKSIDLIKKNTRKINNEKIKILELDYLSALNYFAKEKQKFNFIFLDPPFESEFGEKCLIFIANNNLLADDGVIIYEHLDLKRFCVPQNLKISLRKKYGKIGVSIIKYAQSN